MNISWTTFVNTAIGTVVAAWSACLLGATTAAGQQVEVQPEELARVVESVERLNTLRERLAASFLHEGGPEADAETFAEVCHPVGRQARQLAEEQGWTVRQMAVRYRNPAHRPDEEARKAHRMMDNHPELRGFWVQDTVQERPGVRYFRRITVRSACLECHGPKEKRPDFVRERYPEDRAYGFEHGDLRGVYSIFVPTPVGSY